METENTLKKKHKLNVLIWAQWKASGYGKISENETIKKYEVDMVKGHARKSGSGGKIT